MEQLTFAKRPITADQKKRHSTISDILPDLASRKSNRTFSEASTHIVDPQMPCDDPLLDYNQQIRAPKFRSTASANDIGSIIDDFRVRDLMKVHSEDQQKSTSLREQTEVEPKTKSTYQPAKMELNRKMSFNDTTPSTSVGGSYSLDKFMKSGGEEDHTKIGNLHIDTNTDSVNQASARATATSSPLSSKKNSNESINYLSSKKVPRFNMGPIRPIDDPKTLSYIPCVLRPTSSNTSMQSTCMTTLLDHSQSYDLTSLHSEFVTNFTKEHWKPNNSTSKCLDCEKLFSIINRRHHCRKCGEIFCSSCLISQAKLNYQCQYDLNGTNAKVCFPCGKEWSNHLINVKFKDNTTLFPNFKDQKSSTKQFDIIKEEDMDTSTTETHVPADWTWSSF